MPSTNINITMSVFNYTPKDFKFIISEEPNEPSELDSIIKKKWEIAENNKVFRYKLNIEKSKVLEGQYKFFVQLNIDRGTKRRQAQNILSMNQPFDANKFNFTKIPQNEILFDIENEDGNNVVTFNVSPIEWGHCLFIPERSVKLPQIMTEHSLLRVVELLLISSSPDFRAAYNSLCGYASVNHLHWHFYYLRQRMLLETMKLNDYVGAVCTLQNYPSKGFCVCLSLIPEKNVNKFAEICYSIIKFLQDKEFAHNVYITRAKCNPESEVFDDIRVYIWARKPSLGIKDEIAFVPAACELFGHIVARSNEAYETMTEDSIAVVQRDITFDMFTSISDDIRFLLNK